MAKELAKLFVTLGLDDKDFQRNINKIQGNLTQMGKAMTGIGVGITAALGLATKAALDEEIGISRLSNALKTAGGDYASLSGEIEKSIAATQKKTSFGDEEQRDALTELISVTGSYEGALEQLALATDLAASKNMDLLSAARLVGRVATGDTELLTRYGIKVREGATATETLAMMQERFAGAAQAAADPMVQLKNQFGDMAQDIGKVLLPVLRSLVEKVAPILDGIRNWIAENPQLARTIVLLAAAIGGVFVVLGPLLMMLPMLAAGFTLMLGPVGLVMAAIIGLIAVGTLLVLNWDKVVAFFQSIPEKLRAVWGNIMNFFDENKWLAAVFPIIGIPALIIKNWETIIDTATSIWRNVGNIFNKFWRDIEFQLTNTWRGITSLFSQAWEETNADAISASNKTYSSTKSVWDKIIAFFQTIPDKLSEIDWSSGILKITGIWEKVWIFISQGWGSSLIVLSNVASQIPGIFGQVGEFLISPFRIAGQWIVDSWTKVIDWFVGIPETIGKAFATLKDIILAPFRAAWHGIETAINWLIDQLNKIQIDIPNWVPGIGGMHFGINLPNISLPQFETGGIITQPTLGLIGEAGPEAVIPLEKMGGMATIVNIYPQNLIGTKEEILRYVREGLLSTQGSVVNLGFS